MFENITWPEGAIYNVTSSKEGLRFRAGADVEHHFTVEGQPNVWIHHHGKKTAEEIQTYVEHRATCNASS